MKGQKFDHPYAGRETEINETAANFAVVKM